MYYREIAGVKVSALGMGNMRLPTVDGQENQIDEPRAQEIIDYAMAHGINYYDTAYRYHGGKSELFLGKALERYPRERYLLASKLPGHMMVKKGGGVVGFTSGLSGWPDNTLEGVFAEQLEKCRTDYFDFYLLHNVCERSLDIYDDAELRVVDFVKQLKADGKVRHLGFSSHAASAATIDDFLTRHEGVFDFVQIQLNYLDWTLQDAKGKYAAITRHGVKAVVMEGVRGGRLAELPAEQMARLRTLRPGDSASRWALRWLQGFPEVAVVLSGMSTLEQIKENVETFAAPVPLTPEEEQTVMEVAEAMLDLVPCTGCRYCTEGCPQALEIPQIIAAYNAVKNGDFMARNDMAKAERAMDPRRCVGCAACSAICPQGIDVPAVMSDFPALLAKAPRH